MKLYTLKILGLVIAYKVLCIVYEICYIMDDMGCTIHNIQHIMYKYNK